MKRLIIAIFFGLFAFSTQAQSIQWYKATSYAFRYVYDDEWTDWSDWLKANINIRFDLNSDVITVYSNRTQTYKILYQEEAPYDTNGTQIKFRVIDQDKDYGAIRLRIDSEGNSQLYVDFSDVMWVYNVYRIR